MSTARKLQLYLSAAHRLGSLNQRGLPFIPKLFLADPPYNRAAYNEFIGWIDQLQLGPVSQIIDVGANHGDFSQAAHRLFPDADILLFEPLPDLQSKLEILCRRYPNWKLNTCALGATNQKLTLHVAEGDDAVGSLVGFSDEYRATNPRSQKNIRQVECSVRPLDEVLSEHKIQNVDLLKIDVEGFEFEVLQGASRTLAKTHAVIIEVSLTRAEKKGESPLIRLLSILQQHGFKTVNIIPSWYDPKNKWQPVEFNVLARRA